MSFIKRTGNPVFNRPVGVIRIQNDQSQFRADMAVANAISNAGKELTKHLIEVDAKKQRDIAEQYNPNVEITVDPETNATKVQASPVPTYDKPFGKDVELEGNARAIAQRKLIRAISVNLNKGLADNYTTWLRNQDEQGNPKGTPLNLQELENKNKEYLIGVTTGLTQPGMEDITANVTIAGSEIIAKHLVEGAAVIQAEQDRVDAQNLIEQGRVEVGNLVTSGNYTSPGGAREKIEELTEDIAANPQVTNRAANEFTTKLYGLAYMNQAGRLKGLSIATGQLLNEIDIALSTNTFDKEEIEKLVDKYAVRTKDGKESKEAKNALLRELKVFQEIDTDRPYSSTAVSSKITKLANAINKEDGNAFDEIIISNVRNGNNLSPQIQKKALTDNLFLEMFSLNQSDNPDDVETANNILQAFTDSSHTNTDMNAFMQGLFHQVRTEPDKLPLAMLVAKTYINQNGQLQPKEGTDAGVFRAIEIMTYASPVMNPVEALDRYYDPNGEAFLKQNLNLDFSASTRDVNIETTKLLNEVFTDVANEDMKLLDATATALLRSMQSRDQVKDVLRNINSTLQKDEAMGKGKSLYGIKTFMPNNEEREVFLRNLTGLALGKNPERIDEYKEWQQNQYNGFTDEGKYFLRKVAAFNPMNPQYIIYDRFSGVPARIGETKVVSLYDFKETVEHTIVRNETILSMALLMHDANKLYKQLASTGKMVSGEMQYDFDSVPKEDLLKYRPVFISDKKPPLFRRKLDEYLESN